MDNQYEIKNRIIKQGLVDWKKLVVLQNNNLKDLTIDGMNKLKNSLYKNNFIQPFNVWEDKDGTIYTLDGVHRSKAMLELEKEGVNIAKELSANFIECENKQEAAKLVLVYSSIYAKVQYEGLEEFLFENNLDIEEVKLEIDIPYIMLDEPKVDEEENNNKQITDTMKIVLEYNERDYKKVKEALLEISDIPEEAIIKLLNIQ